MPLRGFDDGRAKVADFGLSQKQNLGGTGTPFWMAPERKFSAPVFRNGPHKGDSLLVA
jgi:serine/threonine protein kinase